MIKLTNADNAASLFSNWEESLIWSCLQNVMGEIFVKEEEHSKSAIAVLGDFCFLAGIPDAELVSYQPHNQEFMIMVPQNREWEKLIEKHYKEKAKKVTRYAFKKEKDIFDIHKLQAAVNNISKEYQIKRIDKEIYQYCKEHDWSKDLVSQYQNFSDYEQLGLGAVVLQKGIPVAGASSYARYEGGIEIEIDTKPEYRCKGLAYACAASLILECLQRGLYPSWDAQNKNSVALAQKLGYHFDYEYTAYEIVY